jgi:hypothetical protein
MANGDKSQEDYLATTGLGAVCVRGVKKLVTELSSVKTLAMVAITGLVYFGKMDSMAGVVGLLGLVGAKEVDFTEVINIVKSRFVK